MEAQKTETNMTLQSGGVGSGPDNRDTHSHTSRGGAVTEIYCNLTEAGDARLMSVRPYKVPKCQKQIDAMLEAGAIVQSLSPSFGPIILVTLKKLDGGVKVRQCIDLHKLKNVTKRNVYPLLLINEMLDIFGGAKYFSTLDCMSGYWQVQITLEDQEKTGFYTPDVHYYCLKIPFNLVILLA
ncbi:hypothetical protein PR048_018929 [Dryococelus australis]|uniref:Reverse transcriptase domain-containing protein n=1 Tax=Dryococelus australis TaxID=614101 RepID=A0ABQ9H262_9NEOP|nr:hypothetical protein PR048_018929 [Dryococelus australis]